MADEQTHATNGATMQIVTAIYDTLSEQILGNALFLHRAEASAIRMFRDIMADKQTPIGQHPHDYSLLQLGIIHDEAGRNMIDSDFRVIITGEQIIAATTLAAQPEP